MPEKSLLRPTLLAALFLVVFGLPAAAVEQTLSVDPASTAIAFHLNATGHDVEGSFLFVQGEIRFDTETGEAGGELRVDATSAETGNKKRDKTMHHKVLESDQYSLFVFKPEHIEGDLAASGPSSLVLEGTMSIHGEDHPLRMEADVERHGDHVTATARFSIPFVDWGMKNPSVLFLRVAKQVQVTVNVAGTLGHASISEALPAGNSGR